MRASLANDVIPVVDLFAGPGGLGEGFSSFRQGAARSGPAKFRICLSIEKDKAAWRTLRLRAFYRHLQGAGRRMPEDYYEHLRGNLSSNELFVRYPEALKAAETEAWNAELGADDPGPSAVKDRIKLALGGTGKHQERDAWVLIGGPPCQAFSIVGRSRNNSKKGYTLKADARHKLYLEYLRVIADHSPPVFVMENVKGMLSATIDGHSLFEQIVDDLSDPWEVVQGRRSGSATGYTLFSLTVPAPEPLLNDGGVTMSLEPRDYVVRAERVGLPQARHRVILIGVRTDLGIHRIQTLRSTDEKVTVEAAIGGMPRLRSGVSDMEDSADVWQRLLKEQAKSLWVKQLMSNGFSELALCVQSTVEDLPRPRADRGSEFVQAEVKLEYERDWFIDSRLDGYTNHRSRSHMATDLVRYLFAACFTQVNRRSPDLSEFPVHLLPAHANVGEAIVGQKFGDRFRVQARHKPSTTIVSHIAKDGHYYIHYDPRQCRSLTVREAARLQTFPDNYFFVGNRTEQYTQVGNAVPPLLARQIADIVHSVLRQTGLAN